MATMSKYWAIKYVQMDGFDIKRGWCWTRMTEEKVVYSGEHEYLLTGCRKWEA